MNYELPELPPPNSKWLSLCSRLGTVLVAVWVGGSIFSIFATNPNLFQSFGAIGVGGLLAHYAFIRSTWSARKYYALSTEAMALAAVLDTSRDNPVTERASVNRLQFQKARASIEELGQGEAKSVAVEVLLVVLATVQWGFGNRLIELINRLV